ncbi:hypothetical protein KY285_036330 [Solanum tuberosum]|nr:hypothetical protein KY285_036330 [Solanum tuberosum]
MVLSQIQFRVMHMSTIEFKTLIEFKGVPYTRDRLGIPVMIKRNGSPTDCGMSIVQIIIIDWENH